MCDSDCARCDAIFEAWVTRFTRASTRRQKSARPTSGSASSSWPTARAHEAGQYQRSGWNRDDERPTLTGAAETWRTPDAPHGGGPRNRTGSQGHGHQVTIAEQAETWPTPVANDDNKTPEAHLAMKRRMGERDGTFANRTAVTSLQVRVQQWQTPATDSFRSRGGDRKDEMGLDQKARACWPPARAEDAESAGNHPGAQDSLTGVTSTWLTPTAQSEQSLRGSGQDPARRRAQGHQVNLIDQVSTWATPAARSAKGGYSEQALTRADGKSRMDILDNQAIYHPSLLDPETGSSGGPSSPSAPTSPQLALLEWIASWWREPLAALCEASLRGEIAESAGELHEERLEALLTTLSSRRQLNPRFAEWLMGWEPGWTSLAPLASASSETGLYLSPPPSPSPTSGDNWPTPDTQNARDGTKRKEAHGKHAMSLHHVVADW